MNLLLALPPPYCCTYVLCFHRRDAPEEKLTGTPQYDKSKQRIWHWSRKPHETGQKQAAFGNREAAAHGMRPVPDHPMKQSVSIPKSRSILPISPHPTGFRPSGTQGRDQMSHISVHQSLLETSSASQ